jgi:hypothetical protein
MTNRPATMTVQHPGGDITITQAAWEMAMEHYSHRTLGNLRDTVNERGDTEHRGLTWVQCIAQLADFDHNVDGDPFSIDRPVECIVDPDRDGPTLWDCECRECRALARALNRDILAGRGVTR